MPAIIPIQVPHYPINGSNHHSIQGMVNDFAESVLK